MGDYLPRTCFMCVLITFYFLKVIAVTEDDKFVEVYGNHYNTSGIWDTLRTIYEDDERLENICMQAHKETGKHTGAVAMALCYTRTLRFHDVQKYKPIEIDLIFYIINGYKRFNGVPYYFYLAKGLRPGCVYYLKPLDDEGSSLMLDEHVCGITI